MNLRQLLASAPWIKNAGFASFTTEQAKEIASKINIKWDIVKFSVEEFRMGLEIEAEHGPGGPGGGIAAVVGDDPEAYGKIAWAHLLELPDYYTRLQKMEADAGI